jgi:hypothetical protein
MDVGKNVMPDAGLKELIGKKGIFGSFVNCSAWAKTAVPEKYFKEALEDWVYFGLPENRPSWIAASETPE